MTASGEGQRDVCMRPCIYVYNEGDMYICVSLAEYQLRRVTVITIMWLGDM